MPPQFREQRLVALAILAVMIILAMMGRLWFLEVAKGAQLRSLGASYRLRVMPIRAPRGKILDRNGNVLVTNVPSFTAEYFDLGHPPSPAMLQKLSAILGVSSSTIAKKINGYRGQPYIPVRIQGDLTPREVTLIAEDRPQLPGVFVQAEPLRKYSLGTVGAQVFGYVQNIFPSELKAWHDPRLTQNSIVGQSGLEFQYQRYLQGTPGGEEVEVDANNRPVHVLGTVRPIPGDNLKLTLSVGLEQEASRALAADIRWQRQTFASKAPARSGAVIVMDVHTGQVLAMVSQPSFNPNWFAQGITQAEAKQAFDPKTNPLLNRAIDALYPPGSTYKMAVAIAALESGAITPQTLIQGKPRYWYPPYPWNWIRVNTAWNDLSRAIGQSNDIFFYETGRRTGIDTIASWAEKLGFGQPTGIDLPGEAKGLVPTKAMYEQQNGGAWYPGLVYSVAIGQGEDLTTLVQLDDYVASIANSGVRYRPYIVQQIVSPSGKTVYNAQPTVTGRVQLPAADWQAIHTGMHWATRPGTIPGNGGTAGQFFQNYSLQVAGKTGTAQVANQPSITWFVSYAPYKNPKYAIAVEVAGGNEGADDAPVARDLYDYLLHINDPGNILAPAVVKAHGGY